MKEEIYKELEDIHSELRKYNKNDIYNPSDKYFAEMQKSVFGKLEDKKNNPKIISFSINKKIMGIAASLVILIAAIFTFKQYTGTSNQIIETDIIEYLSIYAEDLDETILASYLDTEDLNFVSENSINTTDIEDYLENNIDNLDEEDLKQLF